MKRKNKITILFLIVFSILAVFTTVSFADTTGKITGITVRLREKPSTDSKIIKSLDKDNKVTVLEKSGDWYKVSYKDDTGYVFGEYIEVAGDIEENTKNEETTQEPVKEELPVSAEPIEIKLNSIQKIEKDTNIYLLPLLSATTVDNLKKDAQVTVLQILNNWVYVTSDNKTGWIIKQNIQIKEQEEAKQEETKTEEPTETVEVKEEKKQTTTEKKIKYVNVENANVRQKPTTDSEHITTLKLNAEVVVLGEENNWYKIEFDKKQGYIYKKLVSDEKTKETTSRSTTQERTTVKEETEQVERKEETATSNQTTNSTASATGANVVAYAKQFLGAKYVSGGNGPSSFDCSGFTCYVYKHFGYSLNRTSGGQASNGTKVEKSDLQPGDILVFLNDSKTQVGHVGIYIGNNTFIHAANPSRGVVTDSVDSSYYAPRYVTARRILN